MEIRLKKQKDFDLVFSKGKRIYTNSLTLIYLKNNNFKFGISLSKKHGKAVLRNRIKRILRSIIRQSLDIIKDNYYIIVLPKVSDNYIFDLHSGNIGYVPATSQPIIVDYGDFYD